MPIAPVKANAFHARCIACAARPVSTRKTMATNTNADMQKVALLSDLADNGMKRVEVNGTPILLIRHGDAVHAFSADCPHAGAPLEEGALCNGRIVCPWHKGTFAIADGSLIEPPPMAGIGAGAAGAAACATLRETGFDGRLVLIGHEHGMPSDRTALSKFVLAG